MTGEGEGIFSNIFKFQNIFKWVLNSYSGYIYMLNSLCCMLYVYVYRALNMAITHYWCCHIPIQR